VNRITTCLALTTLLYSFSPTLAHADAWQAGVARVNITPEKPMWMSGYAGRNRPAEGKLTDLWAKALVLQDPAGDRAVLVTLDLIGIGRALSQRVCSTLAEQHQFQRSQIILSTTHTHTGPVVGRNLRAMYFFDDAQYELVKEYTAKLEQDIVKAVSQALEDLAPARLSWSTGYATFAVNRRDNNQSKVPELRARGELAGPVDYSVPVLAVRDLEGDLQTVVCGYACHATVLSFYQWSGDWPGFSQIEIEKRHPGVTAMVWIGCGADQNPLPRRSVKLAQEYGRQLAEAVDLVLASVMPQIEGALETAYAEIDLPFSRIPTRSELQAATQSNNRYETGRAKVLLAQLEEQGEVSPTYPYPIQTWQLGDGPQLVALGGEVVIDYALRIKSERGARTTWVMAYANDVMAYIASRRVIGEGGYEGGGSMVFYGLPSPWSPEIENMILQEVQRQDASIGGNVSDASAALSPPAAAGAQ